ncbi:MAG TPA: nuclear transport factor 2 family protein [Burkholderiaceae bacterium]
MRLSISRSLCTALAALAVASCSLPHATEPAASVDATVRLLTTQADAWDKAIVAKDAAAVAANVAPDFTQIDSSGAVNGRDEFIQGLLDPGLRIAPYTVEEFNVRVYGDTALLTGRIRMTGISDGQPFQSHFRYIDVYVKRDGLWKVVSIQITRMRS